MFHDIWRAEIFSWAWNLPFELFIQMFPTYPWIGPSSTNKFTEKMKSLIVTFLAMLFPKNAISLAVMSVFHASVLLLIKNFVITLPIASKIHSYFDNVTYTKFMVNNRTDAWKTDASQLVNKLSTLIHWRIA